MQGRSCYVKSEDALEQLTFLASAKEGYEHAVISPGKSHIL